ncbi:hypothetical protein ABAZ39_11525 [Azospirillum argentinense]|uniref:Uncharacterized protein n=1 Tax=Azospirillum argentinense TaxID=2970906 RepID=A0A060DEL8_9PROT|nr:gamma-mobile-trio protein GmtX [Azospirillum argentinense]AIB12611.1 hypothetical protein ABAZ39_11525 [Azospirillum argentinense]EZQ09856.1 hypothetical protein ABAZ39_12955 [Azospirillum argentinense]
MTAEASFEEVVSEILSRSNARKKTTILALKGVLEGMRAKGVQVYRIVDVGRACEEACVLTTQAIRNKSGDDFKSMIEAFARSIGAATTHLAPSMATPLEQTIASIADLDARTRLRAMIAENKALRAEVNRLKEGFKRLREAPAAALKATEIAPIQMEVLPPLKGMDVVPLERFLSEDWLGDLDWRIGEDGAIYEFGPAGQGVRLTPIGFVSALKGAIKLVRGA